MRVWILWQDHVMNSIKKRESRRHKRHDKQVWKKEVEIEIGTEKIDKGVSRKTAEKESW